MMKLHHDVTNLVTGEQIIVTLFTYMLILNKRTEFRHLY